jgi:hypothetical protein
MCYNNIRAFKKGGITMQAFEFQTTAQDGFIRIPDRFKSKMTSNIKVIILSGEQEKLADSFRPKKASFPYFAVDTTGYVFDREEANER